MMAIWDGSTGLLHWGSIGRSAQGCRELSSLVALLNRCRTILPTGLFSLNRCPNQVKGKGSAQCLAAIWCQLLELELYCPVLPLWLLLQETAAGQIFTSLCSPFHFLSLTIIFFLIFSPPLLYHSCFILCWVTIISCYVSSYRHLDIILAVSSPLRWPWTPEIIHFLVKSLNNLR